MSTYPVMSTEGGQCIGQPDVCKVPGSPPVPTPMVNKGSPADGSGAKKVKVRGNSVLRKYDKFSRSSGDEAGSVGGVVSSQNLGPLMVKTGAPKVKAEGKEVAFLTATCAQNGNNANQPAGKHVSASQDKVKVEGEPPPSDALSSSDMREWLKAAGVPDSFHDTIIDSFVPGTAKSKHVGTDAPSKQFRAFDKRSTGPHAGKADEFGMKPAKMIGAFTSPNAPLNQLEQQVKSALPFANKANMFSQQAVKPCTMVLEGQIAGQVGNKGFGELAQGGNTQTFIPGNPSAPNFPVSTTSGPFPLPGL